MQIVVPMSGFGERFRRAGYAVPKPLIIAVGDGVYESSAATPAHKSQLRCYFDVVSRQDGKEELSTLNALQVSELLDWDAEKYRQSSTNNKQVVA